MKNTYYFVEKNSKDDDISVLGKSNLPLDFRLVENNKSISIHLPNNLPEIEKMLGNIIDIVSSDNLGQSIKTSKVDSYSSYGSFSITQKKEELVGLCNYNNFFDCMRNYNKIPFREEYKAFNSSFIRSIPYNGQYIIIAFYSAIYKESLKPRYSPTITIFFEENIDNKLINKIQAQVSKKYNENNMKIKKQIDNRDINKEIDLTSVNLYSKKYDYYSRDNNSKYCDFISDSLDLKLLTCGVFYHNTNDKSDLTKAKGLIKSKECFNIPIGENTVAYNIETNIL